MNNAISNSPTLVLHCRGSRMLQYLETLIRDANPTPDLTHSEIARRALNEAEKSLTTEERVIALSKKIKFLKNKVEKSSIIYPTSIAITLPPSEEEKLLRIIALLKQSLKVTTLRTQILLTILLYNYLSQITQHQTVDIPAENGIVGGEMPQQVENPGGADDDILGLIEDFVHLVRKNSGDSHFIQTLKSYLEELKGEF